MKSFTLSALPAPLLRLFLRTAVVKGKVDSHRKTLRREFAGKDPKSPLNASNPKFKAAQPKQLSAAKLTTAPILWATDNYSENGRAFGQPIWDTERELSRTIFRGTEHSWESFDCVAADISGSLHHSLELITPRKDKALAVQKLRTKEKAEVFTPSWVCNLQNNLADDHSIRPGAFNVSADGSKAWEPTAEQIFEELQDAVAYIAAPRLEITCGEAPYLVSRYDTVSGDDIPVRDNQGRFQRIGILDRKLRVVAETAGKDLQLWDMLALEALKATYGYEWQGDSLLLARLNVLNSFLDYRADFIGNLSEKKQAKLPPEQPPKELLLEAAEIICWNLWQMDGLKMVTPLSCSDACLRCQKGRLKDSMQKHWGHDGKIPVIRFKGLTIPFEDMVFYGTAEKQMLPLTRQKVAKIEEIEPAEAPTLRISIFDLEISSKGNS